MSRRFATPFVPSVSICSTLGAVCLTRPGEDGIPHSETRVYVTDPQELRGGTQPFSGLQFGVVGASTRTPVLAVCFMVQGTACYVLVDPLDPGVRPALEQASSRREFIVVTAFGEYQTSARASSDIFSRLQASCAGRQHAGRGEWLRRAARMVSDLPSMFAEMEPQLRGIRDHRVVFTLPFEELKAMCGA